MDFARRQLEKYGWSEGKGLGKNENGIAEALKPKLKRSVTGVGHNPASDFTEHWWNDLYNKAAKNLEVKEVNGRISVIKQRDSSDFEITNNTWQLKKKKTGETSGQLYASNFVKKSILCNGGCKVENINECDSEAEETKKFYFMTDEELYAACEGRTAHKGARHGLKALGKLARVEQQEQILLNESKYIGYSHTKKLKENNSIKKHTEIVENNDVSSPIETNKYDHECSLREKNIKDREKIMESTEKKTCVKRTKFTKCIKEEQILVLKKEKNKRKDAADFVITNNNCDQMNLVPSRKKKRNKDYVNNNEKSNVDLPTVQNDLDVDSIKKHKKKKKNRNE